MRKLSPEFFARDTQEVGKGLLGKAILKDGKAFVIVETESYLGEHDLASHARFGNKGRSAIMFDKPGLVYVYMIYGMHFMLNFVSHLPGEAGAVLIRAVYSMQEKKFIIGPGKLAKTLGITKEHNYKMIGKESGIYVCQLNKKEIQALPEILKKPHISLPRVGVDYAGEWAKKHLRYSLLR